MWFSFGGRSARRAVRPRKAKRFVSDLLSCPLGDIVNVSGDGLRLRLGGRPAFVVGQILSVTLRAPQSSLTLSARVIWIRRRGIRNARDEAGLQFLDMRPQMVEAVRSLAQFGFVPRMQMNAGFAAQPGVAGAGGAGRSAAADTADASGDRLPDYYAMLGVSNAATLEQIHAAYRARARLLHPDVNKAPNAAAEFDAVCKAYRVLRDPDRREGYDLTRSLAAC